MRSLVLLLFIGICSLGAYDSYAQGQEKYITFSGFVIDGKSDEPLPGAYIINERAGRGTLSNSKGYFLIDVFPGDSLVFSYLGFKKQYHIIPKDVTLNYSAVVELMENATMLKEVKVYPFRNEEEFKLALIEMELPDARDRDILDQNFSKANLERAMALQGMGAGANYRYAMNQQLMQIQSQGQMTVNPLTNVFSWGNFIKSVKDGSFQSNFKKKSPDYVVPRDAGTRDQIFRNSGN
ncbi:CarboxypepD_reg-like domain-containing protein [Spirosomataceae bacterium TFI 002]|nr:CarboxypepD_reg-like domain-containing protein [Spirosomataceae bacterium TFI 002]